MLYHSVKLHKFVQRCTTLYDAVELCTTIYNYVQRYKTVYDAIQFCTTLYNAVQLFMTLKICTIRYNPVKAL